VGGQPEQWASRGMRRSSAMRGEAEGGVSGGSRATGRPECTWRRGGAAAGPGLEDLWRGNAHRNGNQFRDGAAARCDVVDVLPGTAPLRRRERPGLRMDTAAGPCTTYCWPSVNPSVGRARQQPK